MRFSYYILMIVVGLIVVSLTPGISHAQTPVTPSASIRPPAAKQFNEQTLKRLLRWAAGLTGRDYPEAIGLPQVVGTSATQMTIKLCPDSQQ